MNTRREKSKQEARSCVAEQLRSRPAAASPAGLLLELCERVKEPGAALGWLAARDEDSRVRDHASMLLFVAAQDPSIPRSFRRPTLRAAGSVLLKAFRDPDVSDEVKYHIGPMASLCGVEISDSEYASAFKDPDGIRLRKTEERLRGMTSHPADLEAHLEALGLLTYPEDEEGPPDEETIAISREVAKLGCRVNPAVGAALLCLTAAAAAEHRMTDSGAHGDLAPAAETGTGEALWYLAEIGRLPALGETGEAAARLARGMEREGIRPSPPDPGRLVEGRVTALDATGTRSLQLVFQRGDDTDAYVLMLNDTSGVEDAVTMFGEAGILVGQGLAAGGIAFAPCDLALARELVGDALASNALAGFPPPARYLLASHVLGPHPVTIRPREADLSAYALEDVPRSPALVKGSEKLARSVLCESLHCTSDDAYRFIERHLERNQGGTRSFRLPAGAMLEYFDTVLASHLPVMIHRLGANLEIEALAGRASLAGNRRLAEMYVVLSERLVPFHLVPFLHELHAEGARRIALNLRMGFESQEEVNDAARAMEMDREEDGP